MEKLQKKILVCSDRDRTINRDENYYLGKSSNWKKQLEFLPGVIEGIKLLNKIPDLEFFILTNQSGVSISYDPKDSEFPNLTEERMHEVNRYIIQELEKQGARISGYFACPYVNYNYVKKSGLRGRTINPKYIQNNHPDAKPNPGMIYKAINQSNGKIEDYNIWVIGDRLTDIQMGLNVPNGKSILVSSFKTLELEEADKIKKIKEAHQENVFIEENFLKVAERIKIYYK